MGQIQQTQQIADACSIQCLFIMQVNSHVLEQQYLLSTSCKKTDLNKSLLYYYASNQECECDFLNDDINKYIRDNCKLLPIIIPTEDQSNSNTINCNNSFELNLNSLYQDIDLNTVSIDSQPTKGTLFLNTPFITYTANENTSGLDNFTFSFYSNGDKITVENIVNINECTPPIIEDEYYTSNCGNSLQLEFPDNYVVTSGFNNGYLNNSNIYIPNTGYFGIDTLQYYTTIPNSNPLLVSNTATVTVNVIKTVTAVDDSAIFQTGGSALISPLDNDIDGFKIISIDGVSISDGDTITSNAINYTLQGNDILISDSEDRFGFDFSPYATYTIQDENGCTSTAKIYITVLPRPEASIDGVYLNDNENYSMDISMIDNAIPVSNGIFTLTIKKDNIIYSVTEWNIGDNLSADTPLTDLNGIYNTEIKPYITGSILNNTNWLFNKYNWAEATSNMGVNSGKDLIFEIKFVNSNNIESNLSSTTATSFRNISYFSSGISSGSAGVLESASSINSESTNRAITSYIFTNSSLGNIVVANPVFNTGIINTAPAIADETSQTDLLQVTADIPSRINNLIGSNTASTQRWVYEEDNYIRAAVIFGNSGNTNVLPYSVVNQDNNLDVNLTTTFGTLNAKAGSPITGSTLLNCYIQKEDSPNSNTFSTITDYSSNTVGTGVHWYREVITFQNTDLEGLYNFECNYRRLSTGSEILESYTKFQVILYSY